jgi:hypothetical protein
MRTQCYLVTPRYVKRIASAQSGLAAARRLDAAAKTAHGNGAGAECHVVAQRGDTLYCGGRGNGGLCVGRRFMTLGCARAIQRVRAALTAHAIRD